MAGSRRVTLTDVAAASGVSRAIAGPPRPLRPRGTRQILDAIAPRAVLRLGETYLANRRDDHAIRRDRHPKIAVTVTR
ncbi:hypothetical protein ABZ896_01575 [Streptomyces sp. NPDC047072]|uniref:hypothetical protein n=1 Tax=Streptomyces sp. NPDC047072 TaxID=3154809 RepID=UPI003411C3DC